MKSLHTKAFYVVIIIALVLLFGLLLTLQFYNYKREVIPLATKEGSMLIRKDVRYCKTNNVSQEYDLYTPANDTESNAPLVVQIHGGGWRWGTKIKGIAEHYAQPLTDRNIALASVDYRLADEATYPAQNNDIHCAIEHLVSNASRYGINPNRIIIMGDSAGGHLAALEALNDTRKNIKGTVLFYGVSDLWKQITKYTDDNALHYLGTRDEALAKRASPLYQDLTNAPPFLLIHGTSDTVVPASESKIFADALIKSGNQATYLPIESANHGFADTTAASELKAREAVLVFIETYI